MKNPFLHSLKCPLRVLEEKCKVELLSLHLKESISLACCAECKVNICAGLLSEIREWDGKEYCQSCFRKLHLREHTRARYRALHEALLSPDKRCALCDRTLSLEHHKVMLEHMNPFEKVSSREPHFSLIRPSSFGIEEIIQRCVQEKVQVVHWLCGSLKTRLEMFLKQHGTRKRVPLEMQDKWKEMYTAKVLPVISETIQVFFKSHQGSLKGSSEASPKGSPEGTLQ